MGIPNGVYRIDNGFLYQSMWKDADIYVGSGVAVQAHEPYPAIGALNHADFLDPTPRGDVSLSNRRIAADIDVFASRFDVMNSSGVNSYGLYNTGFGTLSGGTYTPDSTGGGENPSAIGGVSIPITSGMGLNNTGIGQYNPNAVGYNPSGIVGSGANGNDGPDNLGNNGKSAQFNMRLGLIEEYCDKYGKIVDVDKIRSEYAKDPEGGLAYCDDILNNKFDQNKLEKMVHKKYQEYNKSRQDAAKAVSDKIVEDVLKSGLNTPKINVNEINTSNVLDVLGSFMANEEVYNGKVSLEQVFEQPQASNYLINVLKAKADEMLLKNDVDDETKDEIVTHIAELRDNYDKYQESIEDDDKHNDLGFNKVRNNLTDSYVKLFEILRLYKAERNDSIAPQVYGLPENSEIKFDDQEKQARKELVLYKNRRKLSRTI